MNDADTASPLELRVNPQEYVLSLDGRVLARMEGGASALLRPQGDRLRDVDIEAAIERAEEWLMPSSKSWQGVQMRVLDETGHLLAALGAGRPASPDEVERAFSDSVEDVVRGRAVDASCLADLVLLRELVHHGAVTAVHLGTGK